MRVKPVTLAGKAFDVAFTFAVVEKITDAVADPFLLVGEGFREQAAETHGRAYTPSIRFGGAEAAKAFHIGHEAAGGKMTLDEIRALCFEAGLFVARDAALIYIAALIMPQNSKELGEHTGEGDGNQGE